MKHDVSCGTAPKGGSDFAEVENICQQIKDGNYESWYRGWKDGAEKLLKRTQRYFF
ncbi:MAG: hypothetical protein ACLTYH_01670 [Streptococcus salivarius]